MSQKTIFESENYFITFNPEVTENRDGFIEPYNVVNKETGWVEESMGNFASALHLTFQYESGIKQILEELKKLNPPLITKATEAQVLQFPPRKQ